VPDALASTANYLKAHGWVHGLPWGVEVELPPGIAENGRKQSFADWAAAGARRLDGKRFPAGEGTLLQPAGPRGPSFLVTKNFFVIKRYNNSNAYALGVAHLGDRIYGGAPFRTPWPVPEAQLPRPGRQASAGGVVR
jgi:membrane-bound lytic murein transglycosylase B